MKRTGTIDQGEFSQALQQMGWVNILQLFFFFLVSFWNETFDSQKHSALLFFLLCAGTDFLHNSHRMCWPSWTPVTGNWLWIISSSFQFRWEQVSKIYVLSFFQWIIKCMLFGFDCQLWTKVLFILSNQLQPTKFLWML